MGSKIKYKSNFLDKWGEKVEFKDWFKNVPNYPSEALCCYCHKNFSIGGHEIGQGSSHMKSLKHKQNVPPDNTSKQCTIKFKEVHPTIESGSSGKELPEFRKQLQVDSMLHKESVLKAEVIWALEILVTSYSFRSSAGKGEVFSYMFPGSEIAKQFQMDKTKASYQVTVFQRQTVERFE